jgi:hopanoid biosynthesis associated RND transporter like protein HpnN
MPERQSEPVALSLTGRLLQRVVQCCCARPALTVSVAFAFAALGVGYAAHSLTLETSKFHLLPLHQRYATLYKDYAEDFGQLEDIVVVVQSPDVETSTAYAARLAGVLRDGALGTARISYRIDASRLETHALLYLPLDTLRNTLDTVASHEELLTDFAATPTLARLADGINQSVGAAFLPDAFGPGAGEERNTAPTHLLRDLLTHMSERIDGQPYRSPWGSLFAATSPAPDGGYFLSHDRRLLYVVIDLVEAPRTFDAEHAAIVTIRRAIATLRPQFPSVEAGVTGAPALFSDELSAASRDGRTASVLALVLTLGLLLLAFRRLVTSSAILVVLALSLGWSLGVITLIVGHLTIFSMMFVSVVIGLGTDYGIYFLFRYREERVLGQTLVGALEHTAARSGPAILLGALTAAVAFYILSLAEFRGIRDFGFISGTAILLAFLSMLTVFPAVLLLVDPWQKTPRLRPRAGRPDAHGPPDARASGQSQLQVPALARLVRYPKTILTLTVLVTGASLWAAPRVGFDYNLLNLQADGTESVVWERKAAAAAGRSVFAALSTATSLAELEVKQAAFQRLSSVSDVQSVLSVLPDRQDEKLALLRRLAAVADNIRPGPQRPLELDALTRALDTLKRRMDRANATSGPGGPSEEFLVISRATTALLGRVKGGERGAVEVALADYQAQLAGDFGQQWQRLQLATRPSPITLDDLPEELRRKFIGKSGRLLLQIYSRLDLWDRASQERFVEELRTVDPDVTGQPIVGYESTRLIERAFRLGLAYAFALIAGIAALMIRRMRETVLAMVPLILGTLWTIAIMQLAGLKFNLVNVWALPLILGSAAEYGVNIVLRSLESPAYEGGPRLARSTVMGVVFNGLTTMAGFGSLLVAHHRGVWSLGLLLVIGSAATLTASLVVLPTLVHRAGWPLRSPADRQGLGAATEPIARANWVAGSRLAGLAPGEKHVAEREL